MRISRSHPRQKNITSASNTNITPCRPLHHQCKNGPIDISDYIGFDTDDVVEEYSKTETDFTNGNYTDKGTWNERGYPEVFVEVPGFDTMLDGAYYSKHSCR